MKREIKCRGFHKFGKVSGWVYGSLLRDGNDYFINEPHTSYNVEPESIGEYTGLKYKDGTEFYEGDIVRCGVDKEAPTALIVFKQQAFTLEYLPITKRKKDQLYEYLESYKYFKLLGNQYENPELLLVE